MKISISREQLQKPLQYIAGVVERRQTLPILSNAFIRFDGDSLSLTGTDLEVEVISGVAGVDGEAGEMTVGARKLLDICRAMPENAEILINQEEEKATIRSGRSRFVLQTLPAGDFPRIETEAWEEEIRLPRTEFRSLLERTSFAMAQQDVRYYLNGLLLDIRSSGIRSVATDGHRLARSELELEHGAKKERQLIVPRKAVLELQRFLADQGEDIAVSINPNHIRADLGDVVFTSKLIDGRYPDYEKVVPPDSEL